VFKTIIPLTPEDDARTYEILMFCKTPKSRQEIQDMIGIKDREYFRKKILTPLINGKLLFMTLPDKPTSKNQKYYFNR
jgi:ATP-dependent DNA helicase RecG